MRFNSSIHRAILNELMKLPKLRMPKEHPVELYSKAMRRAYMNLRSLKTASLGGDEMEKIAGLMILNALEKRGAVWPWLLGAGIGGYLIYKGIQKGLSWAESSLKKQQQKLIERRQRQLQQLYPPKPARKRKQQTQQLYPGGITPPTWQ